MGCNPLTFSYHYNYIHKIKGECGLPESIETPRSFTTKLDKLKTLIQQSKYTVVLTGAGISTSAGIPDFRGPNGIWTKEKQKQKQLKQNSKKRRKLASPSSASAAAAAAKSPQTLTFKESLNSSEKKKNDANSNSTSTPKISFENAEPTYTHRALAHLITHPPPSTDDDDDDDDDGESSSNDDNDSNSSNAKSSSRTYLHHIVTQNVDGLHRKTQPPLPRHNLSILHGCIFTEICDTCSTEHVRPTEIQSIGLQHTGRKCTLGGMPVGTCHGQLRDTLLDWEDALPEADWYRAQMECSKADLIICLGTSLRIEPAASLCKYPMEYPWPWDTEECSPEGEWHGNDEKKKPKGEKKQKKGVSSSKKKTKLKGKLGYAIVNLQETPYDKEATLVIRAKVDYTLRVLMETLGYDDNDWDDDESKANDNEADVAGLLAMGFPKDRAIQALQQTKNDVKEAINKLLLGV